MNLGQFSISIRMIEDDFEKIAELFARLKIIPVRAEMLYQSNSVQYTALSPWFHPVPEGCIPTEYILYKDDETFELREKRI